MTAQDWIFWYTGASVWGILSLLLALAAIIGLVSGFVYTFHKARKIGWTWLISSRIRDMGLDDIDVIEALKSQDWAENFDVMLGKLRKVQETLKFRTAANVVIKDQLYPPTESEIKRMSSSLSNADWVTKDLAKQELEDFLERRQERAKKQPNPEKSDG